jgi:hypothetical protein
VKLINLGDDFETVYVNPAQVTSVRFVRPDTVVHLSDGGYVQTRLPPSLVVKDINAALKEGK